MTGDDGQEGVAVPRWEASLLGALPPDEPLADWRLFEAHERRVGDALAEVPSFEIATLRHRLLDRQDALGRRFLRFGSERQARLLGFLTSGKRLAEIRARERVTGDRPVRVEAARWPCVEELPSAPPGPSAPRSAPPQTPPPPEPEVRRTTIVRTAEAQVAPRAVKPPVPPTVEEPEEPAAAEPSPSQRSLREHWDARYPLFRANFRHAVAHVMAVHLRGRDPAAAGPVAMLERTIRSTLDDHLARLAPSLGELASEVVDPTAASEASAAKTSELGSLWDAPLRDETFGVAIGRALVSGRTGRALDRLAAGLADPLRAAFVDAFVTPLRRAPREQLEQWCVDYDPSGGDDWFHGGTAWCDYLTRLDEAGEPLADLTRAQRIAALRQLVAPRTARTAGGRVLQLFETAPAIERAVIYEAVAGRPWRGDERNALETVLTGIQARRLRDLLGG